jgi:hypothetical protein
LVSPVGITPALRTRLTHVPTAEYEEDSMPLSAGKETPQGQGSAITYARRYSLMAALNIVADKDDDANAAQPKATTVSVDPSNIGTSVTPQLAEPQLGSPFAGAL